MQLSERLQAVADFIRPCRVLADVGTDHGYIPIYVLENKKAKKAIAMDINRGPMERAASHIALHGLEAYIDCRCCDGLAGLREGEADGVVIAGMGGTLMQQILEYGQNKLTNIDFMVLQPQSEIGKVREYLGRSGYRIDRETMVLEDGKFYVIMQVIRGSMDTDDPVRMEFGPCLLDDRHPVLLQYLKKSERVCNQILNQLYDNGKTENDARVLEIRKEMQNIHSAYEYYEM